MHSIIESNLTVSAVLLKFYQDVAEKAEKGQVPTSSLDAHINDLLVIVGSYYKALNSDSIDDVGQEQFQDMVETATSFNYILKLLYFYKNPDNGNPNDIDKIYLWKDPGAEA